LRLQLSLFVRMAVWAQLSCNILITFFGLPGGTDSHRLAILPLWVLGWNGPATGVCGVCLGQGCSWLDQQLWQLSFYLGGGAEGRCGFHAAGQILTSSRNPCRPCLCISCYKTAAECLDTSDVYMDTSYVYAFGTAVNITACQVTSHTVNGKGCCLCEPCSCLGLRGGLDVDSCAAECCEEAHSGRRYDPGCLLWLKYAVVLTSWWPCGRCVSDLGNG
jgi:hypothetical protein